MMTPIEQGTVLIASAVLVIGIAGFRVLLAKIRFRKESIAAAMCRHPAGNRL